MTLYPPEVYMDVEIKDGMAIPCTFFKDPQVVTSQLNLVVGFLRHYYLATKYYHSTFEKDILTAFAQDINRVVRKMVDIGVIQILSLEDEEGLVWSVNFYKLADIFQETLEQ